MSKNAKVIADENGRRLQVCRMGEYYFVMVSINGCEVVTIALNAQQANALRQSLNASLHHLRVAQREKSAMRDSATPAETTPEVKP